MPDNGWIQVMKTDALRLQGMAAVFPKGLPVLIIRKTADELYAVANKCPHMGCPLPRGRLDGYVLQCPCTPFHRAHFDAMKRCWCGLFVHKDVTDPSRLKQIPPDKFYGKDVH